jgi:hypothetical protein
MTIPAKYADRLLISAAELAALTPFKPRLIASLCERGALRGRKVCGQWMVETPSAWEWLGCCAPQKSEPSQLARDMAKSLGW